jgi:hypothetical protein
MNEFYEKKISELANTNAIVSKMWMQHLRGVWNLELALCNMVLMLAKENEIMANQIVELIERGAPPPIFLRRLDS